MLGIARTAKDLVTTLRFVLDHPVNRRARAAALARYVGWQVWKRTTRRPLTIRFWDSLRLRAGHLHAAPRVRRHAICPPLPSGQ